jgi:hypothetical protein
MKLKNSKRAAIFFVLMFFLSQTRINAQTIPVPDQQMSLQHTRSMLHETIYNTGEIGQPTTVNQTVMDITNPMMEWPPYVKPVVSVSGGTLSYPGEHNGYGSGVYISANYKGTKGIIAIGGTPNPSPNRVTALCGGATGSNNRSYLQYSWPVTGSFKRTENYPVLSDGSINPAFNPNEAEEIITAKWNTNAGISVTRTSRAYSYPDFDDFIIYEYEFENNGIFFNTNTSQLVHMDTTLVDVYITFMYAVSPSAFGEIRHYAPTTWAPHLTGIYTTSFWDPDYGVLYNQVATQDSTLAGFPEKDPTNFINWSQSGKYGGGLLSPQAAGFNVMYYDTVHLSHIDTTSINSPNNQSPQYDSLRQTKSTNINSNMMGVDLDANGRIKQPYNYYTKNGTMTSSFAIGSANDFSTRLGKNNFYYPGPGMATYNRKTVGKYLVLNPIYTGRAIPLEDDYPFNANYPIRTASYGLYYLKPGDKIHFTTAEMIGYGADTSKLVIGGFYSTVSGGSVSPYHPGFFWNRPVSVGGQIVTKNYFADFGLPDYVNPKVVTIQDVAHKAYEAYIGHSVAKPKWDLTNPPINPPLPLMWPENNPAHGMYTVPIPIPAPAIQTFNTDTATVVIKWKRDVENFENLYSTYVTDRLAKFIVFRADEMSGPWKVIGTVLRGHVNSDGIYQADDIDRTFSVGESKFYAVVSVDSLGNKSGKTNITLHNKQIGPVVKLGKVYVVPNPYNATLGWKGDPTNKSLGFYGLPAICTINIYSFAGQRLFTIEHNGQYNHNFELVTRNFQDYASGVYFYVVTTPMGDKFTGKFVVVK